MGWMGVAKVERAVEPSVDAIERKLAGEGLSVQWWRNGPGDTYTRHSHGYHKVLFCERGSIVFHTDDGDFELGPGDRLDVEPLTEHGATVGANGVRCAEGHRR
jgi:quercetin dioxygenase-like cupin family protein